MTQVIYMSTWLERVAYSENNLEIDSLPARGNIVWKTLE